MFNDEITLISIDDSGDRVDGEGFKIAKAESKRIIFANKISITTSEFYHSKQANYNIALKFEVRSVDYNDEKVVEYKGKRYKAERTFSKKNEITELTLSLS